MAKPTVEKGGWIVVALLFFFMLINFVDKAVMGLAAVPIMKELHLSPKQFGEVAASFFYFFSISAVVTGFVVNYIQARWALLLMALIWALSQFPMFGAVGIGWLMASRIVLGAGEGPAYPVALHSAYKFFPNEHRTLPTAVIAQGAAIGVVIALRPLDWIIEEYSWHVAFGLLGVVGMVWVIAWFLLGREGSITTTEAPSGGQRLDRVSYLRLLFNGTTLSGFAAGFGAYWGLSLLVSWFTPYLVQGLHFTQKDASWITTLPWAAGPFVVVSAGWLSQRMLASGMTTRGARGIFGGGSVAFGGICLMLMPYVPGSALKITMMVIGIAVPSVIYVMGHAMVSEFTPVPQRSAMLGINNAVATLAGVVAPMVMGNLVQDAINKGASAAEGYERGFLICGVVAVVCGIIGMMFLRPGNEAARFAAIGGAVPAPAVGE